MTISGTLWGGAPYVNVEHLRREVKGGQNVHKAFQECLAKLNAKLNTHRAMAEDNLL